MKGLSSISERKLIRWAAAYAAVAWGVLQGMDVLAGMWNWPPAVGRLAFVVLSTGLGFTLVMAWFHGERGRQRMSTVEGVLLAGLTVAGAGSGLAVWRAQPVSTDHPEALASAAPASTLAVLPFRDQSPGGGRGYLGDGIAETLISSLARVDALRVVARTSAFAFRDSGDVREIGRRLGAGSIVEGTVTQLGARVRITASLVDASTGEDLWADRFDKEADEADLFELQDDVARQIVDVLRVRLAGGGPIVHRGTRSPDAQRAYYLGVHHWTLRTTEDMQRATELFREAIAADSMYAEAWSGLALAYDLSTPQEYAVPGITREEALDSTEAAARHALALDPSLASAYAALGDAAVQRGDQKQGEHWFREAIRVGPSYATAHHWLADLLMSMLDGEGALSELDVAEALDPVAPAIVTERTEALMMLGRYDEAVAQIEKSIDLDPDAELPRSFGMYFFMRMETWDRVAEQVRRLGRIAGLPEEGDALAEAMADPQRRGALLQELADAAARGGERAGSNSKASLVGLLAERPELRFIVTLELHGMDAALDLLESMANGPEAPRLYPPILPALIGPEALGTERVQRLIRRIRERRWTDTQITDRKP